MHTQLECLTVPGAEIKDSCWLYINQGKNPEQKPFWWEKVRGKSLNKNWHISTILKKVCSVIQHHSRFFKCLSVASSVCNTSNEITLNQLQD